MRNRIKLRVEINPPRAPYRHICLCRQNRVLQRCYRDRHRCFEHLSNHPCHPCRLDRPYHHALDLLFCHFPLDYGSCPGRLLFLVDYGQGIYYSSSLVFHFDRLDVRERYLLEEHDLRWESDGEEGRCDGKSRDRILGHGQTHDPNHVGACHDHPRIAKKKRECFWPTTC